MSDTVEVTAADAVEAQKLMYLARGKVLLLFVGISFLAGMLATTGEPFFLSEYVGAEAYFAAVYIFSLLGLLEFVSWGVFPPVTERVKHRDD